MDCLLRKCMLASVFQRAISNLPGSCKSYMGVLLEGHISSWSLLLFFYLIFKLKMICFVRNGDTSIVFLRPKSAIIAKAINIFTYLLLFLFSLMGNASRDNNDISGPKSACYCSFRARTHESKSTCTLTDDVR